ncbi:MAG: hypothetical protein WCI95_08555 [bacterium]
MSTETGKQGNGSRAREQKLAFYHPNAAGNGVALQLEPRVNRREADRYNCFFFEMAAQKTVSERDGEKRVMPTFDWANKLTVKLDFADICELLLVLEGRQERVGGQKNGIYHDSDKANTIITFGKIPEKGGYSFGLSRKDKESGQLTRLNIGLSEAEAIGLRYIIQSGLFFITFHTHVFPRTETQDSGS